MIMTNEDMATALEATGDYRVLRRLIPRKIVADAGGAETKLGIMLDLETTGMTVKDEIIEMAMVPFTFTGDGRLIEFKEPFHRLRQPTIPISATITRITGLTDADVAGHIVDLGEVEALVSPAVLIIAHHAGFDRPFCERFAKVFASKAWGCSMSEVDWEGEGFEGKKLGYLAQSSGFFYDRHKAVPDCYAALELLASPLPKSGVLAFTKLLAAVRTPQSRIWATNSPFETKDILKTRGYEWNDGSDGRPKAWHVDVPEIDGAAEVAFLHREIYKRVIDLRIERITCFTRFK